MVDEIYDLDDFWDLTPHVKKKTQKTMEPFSSKPATVLVEDDGTDSSSEGGIKETPLTCFGDARSFTDDAYEPTYAPLISRITIRHFNDRYDFYDGFRKSAILYYDVHGTKCDFVPFYSYMPQYTQMNSSQKAYYFYLRDEIRKGNYIRADYSYIYLYAYEIFNLSELIPPEEGIRILCALWRAYRKELPRIDKYFSLWVEDYCLVWKLPSPTAAISDFIFDILKNCTLREFYLSDIRTACVSGVLSLVSVLSDYDWRSGRYATGESAKVYRAHMEGALGFVLSSVLEDEIEIIQTMPTQKLARDAFVNSLCTHSVKCRLEIEYHSLEQLKPLREKIGNLVRYIENRLRKELGVKSRLTIKELPQKYTQYADMYFESVFKKAEQKNRAENIPEYEKHYDALPGELSSAGAMEIEEESWETTFRLVSDLETTQICEEESHAVSFDFAPVPATKEVIKTNESDCSSSGFGEVLQMLFYGNTEGAKKYSAEKKVPLDYFVEQINEYFLEQIGDSVIESDGTNYTIIDDYREDIEEWLTK